MNILAKELEMIARVIMAEDLRDLEDEDEGSRGVYYRGCSVGEALGSFNAFPIWLTDVLEYAKEYADGDFAIVKYRIDMGRLNYADDSYFEGFESEFDLSWDPYDPGEEFLRRAVEDGYNCYEIERGTDTILVLLDEGPVVSKEVIYRGD